MRYWTVEFIKKVKKIKDQQKQRRLGGNVCDQLQWSVVFGLFVVRSQSRSAWLVGWGGKRQQTEGEEEERGRAVLGSTRGVGEEGWLRDDLYAAGMRSKVVV